MRPKLCLVESVNRMLAAPLGAVPQPDDPAAIGRAAFEDMEFRGARAEADLARGHSHEDDVGDEP